MQLRSLLRLGFAAFLASAVPVASTATPMDLDPPTLDINGWTPSSPEQIGCTDSVYSCSGGTGTSTPSIAGPSWTLSSWNLSLDPDPTVTSFFAIQNNLAVPQTFVITVLLPITPIGPPVDITGSVGGSTTDANGNGVTLTSNAPNPIYRALIDGLTVQTLLNDPQSFSAGTFGSATIGPASFGPTNLNQAATSDIAITIRFTLTPGDLASFTAVFNVEEAPEPGATMLLGAGIALLAWRIHRSGAFRI